MPNVDFESFGASSTKNPQPSLPDKAKIVLALWEKSKDPNYDVQAVVVPIMEALGRSKVMKPGQLNGYKKTVKKAVQANNREVIAVLKAGGYKVIDDEPSKEPVAVPLDRTTGESSDPALDQN